MSASGDGPRLSQSLEYISVSERLGRFDQTVVQTIGGIFVAIGAAIIAFADSVAQFFVGIFDAFGAGSADWIGAFTSAPANYITSAFESGADSFTNSAFAQLGPFLPIIAVLVSLLVVFAVSYYLDQRNSDVPGTGLNIPFIGNDSDGEED
jgi:hypothetical protein